MPRPLLLRAAGSLVLLASTLGGAPVALPAPAPALAAEAAAISALTGAVVAAEVVRDDAGHVTHLALSNHSGTERGKAGRSGAPGVTPETFRAVLALPRLQAIAIEKQPLGDADYALLADLPELVDVRLHYADGTVATPDFPLFLNRLRRPLRVLELKHHFSIKGGCMDRLQPQPELEKLELDTGYAGPAAVAFIEAAPRLRNLQLHRTSMSDADLQRVFAALPHLELLEVRPQAPADHAATPISTRSLRGLAACPRLRLVRLSLDWREIVYEGGLDVLAALPDLQYLFFSPGDYKAGPILDHPAVRRLHEARPDIQINRTLGGPPGATLPSIDADSNWDRGVTTHG